MRGRTRRSAGGAAALAAAVLTITALAPAAVAHDPDAPLPPEEWLTVTAPAVDASVTSPVDVTWEADPQLVEQIAYFEVLVDRALRYLPTDARSTSIPMHPGASTVTVAAVAEDGHHLLEVDVNVTVAEPQHVPFPDVAMEPSPHPFFDEIFWLVQSGITTGYADGTFRPAWPINRDAMAAFLFRYEGADLYGYEAPETPVFTDVPTSHPFYTEISWMYDMGISTGYSDGTYRPSIAVNRDAMAAFLFRFEGSPEFTPAGDAFTDVADDHPFFAEIAWMYETGLSTGYSDGTYRPSSSIARDAMAAFLYRLGAEDEHTHEEETPPAG